MIGPHVINATPEAFAWAKRARIVKALDRVDVLQAALPDSVRVFRHYFPQQNLDDPIGAANAIIGALGGYRHPNLYVEVWNEVHPTQAQLTAAVTALHNAKLKVAGGSWGTGDYTATDWLVGKLSNADALAVHCYWGTQGFTDWHATRYRMFWRPGDPPVILSEVGRDAVEGGLGGWKKDGLTDEQYLSEINAYAAEIAKDSYVLGATPFTSGPSPDWQAFSMDPISARIPTGGAPVIADYTSPNHGGLRAQTLGIVIHATLSGKDITVEQEYQSTIGWFENPASEVSAHAIVGPGGKVHRSVRPEMIGWHARASNNTWLGLEMAKSHVNDAIEPAILDRAAQIVAAWCKQYAIPAVWSTVHGIEEHRRMPTNTDGHSDVGGPFDRADFLNRVKVYMGETLTDTQKKVVLDDLDILWGMSKADTIKANPAESERAIHERIVALKVTLGLH